MEERKTEEFKDDRKKWRIYFDLPVRPMEYSDPTISIRFMTNKETHCLAEKDIEKLKQDLRDLGKLRIIKQGEEFLKDESRT